MNKIIGYSRKSTTSQTNAPDVDALKQAGCEIVFEENVSTRKAEKDRPELMKCLASLRKGDVLKLTSLSRLGRTQREVINRLHELQAQEINVVTLDGLINLGFELLFVLINQSDTDKVGMSNNKASYKTLDSSVIKISLIAKASIILKFGSSICALDVLLTAYLFAFWIFFFRSRLSL